VTPDRSTALTDRETATWSYEEPARVDPWRTWLLPLLVGLALLARSLVVGLIWTGRVADETGPEGGMTGTGGATAGLPAVAGYAHEHAVAFVHTEASDPQVAPMLGQMMGSPEFVVPQLADVPNDALGAVFVFSNGVKPDGPRGPFGFQPDVFDSVPGDAGYRPLRRIHLVSWRAGVTPRPLRSAGEIVAAANAGELTIETSSTVVDMPMIRWAGGSRR
jgi:hypothetical protein